MANVLNISSLRKMATSARLLMLVAVLLPYGGLRAGQQSQLSGYGAARNLRANVVRIRAKWDASKAEEGYGFIAGERQSRLYVVTANHVVRSADPGDSRRDIEVKFHSEQGQWYQAELLDTFIEDKDLAVVRVRKPQDFMWKKDCLAKETGDLGGSHVWFIGRTDADDKWFIPRIPGLINSGPNTNYRITVEANSVRVGTSGAPLITEGGIVGMIISDSEAALVKALHITPIKEAFELWQYPWELYSETANTNSATSAEPPAVQRLAGLSGSPLSTYRLNLKIYADSRANGWTSSGVVVRRGQTIRITASGNVSLGRGRNSVPSGVPLLDLEDKLMPDMPTGAVIAVIGDDNNDFIFIGGSRTFTAQRDGPLFLGVNEGNLLDNTGAYDATIEFDATTNISHQTTVLVRANNTANGWTDSGLSVSKGQRLRIDATGRISLGRGLFSTPAGLSDVSDFGKLMQNQPTGALVVVIGNDNNDFIFVGSGREFIAQRSGRLFLGVNEDNLRDNHGSYRAVITYERVP